MYAAVHNALISTTVDMSFKSTVKRLDELDSQVRVPDSARHARSDALQHVVDDVESLCLAIKTLLAQACNVSLADNVEGFHVAIHTPG